MGLIKGAYDAKAGFVAGASSIHNQFLPHGLDAPTVEKGTEADPLKPERYSNTLAFMLESNKVWTPTEVALEMREKDYINCWDGIKSRFNESDVPPENPPYPFD